jgi:hypothetical protein
VLNELHSQREGVRAPLPAEFSDSARNDVLERDSYSYHNSTTIVAESNSFLDRNFVGYARPSGLARRLLPNWQTDGRCECADARL